MRARLHACTHARTHARTYARTHAHTHALAFAAKTQWIKFVKLRCGFASYNYGMLLAAHYSRCYLCIRMQIRVMSELSLFRMEWVSLVADSLASTPPSVAADANKCVCVSL